MWKAVSYAGTLVVALLLVFVFYVGLVDIIQRLLDAAGAHVSGWVVPVLVIVGLFVVGSIGFFLGGFQK